MQFNPLPILVIGAGLYFLIKLRFFFIIHPVKTVKKATGLLKDKKAFSGLTLALAGTLGVGNIFGVAIGIIVGGAGSVFWILVSALFSSVLKYSEVAIATEESKSHDDSCAFYGVLQRSFKKHGTLLSVIYALSTVLLSFFMGASLQIKAVIDSAYIISNVPVYISSLIIGVLIFLAVIAGAKKIQKITLWLIPTSTIIYILMSICVIAVNFEAIPKAVTDIICSAFSLEACAGGSCGFLSMKAIKEGFCRGMLSNEAGAGTSSTAHISSGVTDGHTAGVLGIIEILFDTVILCTLTGLVILTSVPNFDEYKSGMALVLDAFTASLGTPFGLLLTVLVFLFAYSTVICWYYYGTAAYCSVFSRRTKFVFSCLFLAFSLFGALVSQTILVLLTDFLMLVLSSLCLIALIKNSDRIKALSERD